MTDQVKARSACCGQAQAADNPSTLLALQLKALGHPARLQIIDCLTRKSGCCCGDVCAELPLAQSTISQHLDLLCKSGLVILEPSGNRSHYHVDRAMLEAVSEKIAQLANVSATLAAVEVDHG